MRMPHPGPVRRFGKAQVSLLFSPWGSPSVPKVAVVGMPSLALKIPPNSQPSTIQEARPESDLKAGTCQVPLITKVLPMLKSDRPRSTAKLGQKELEIELVHWLPASVEELVSMLLPHVNDPCSCRPRLILLAICASKASKNEFPAHTRDLI